MSIVLQRIVASETNTLLPLLLDADEGEQRIRARLVDEAYTSYAALEEERLVGAIVMRWQPDESEIEYIAVSLGMRGRGYGKVIMAEMLTEARQRGVHSVLVGTANTSWENISFYQKCGFRMDHVRKNYFDYIQPPILEHGILMQDMIVLRCTL